jgi:hypothetical protein
MSYARVQAVRSGQYGEIWRDVGDVFDIQNAADFSDSTVSQVPVGNPDYPLYGWMLKVPPTTALYSYVLANGANPPVQVTFPAKPTRPIVFGIPRYVV